MRPPTGPGLGAPRRALPRAAWTAAVLLAAALAAAGCGTTRFAGPRPAPASALPGGEQVGQASYYANRFHGRRTASGERYDRDALTAAHPSLAFGTRIRVTHLGNGRAIVLRVNDRGPFRRGRIVDVSRAAARRLGFLRDGVARVRLEVVEAGETAAGDGR